MKFVIKIKEAKKLKFPSTPYHYIRFTTDEKIDAVSAQFGFSSDKKTEKYFSDENVKEIKFTPEGNPLSAVSVIKTDAEKIDADFFRDKLAEKIIDASPETETIIIDFPSTGKFIEKLFGNFSKYAQTIVEGILLGNYTFDKFKSEKKKPGKLNVILYNEENISIKNAINKAEKLTDAVYFARDLVNEPANTLTPQEFAKRLKKEFKGTNVKVEVLDENQIKKRNMNALYSVGQASVNPPLLIKLTYKGKKAKEKIAFVGKGVMYDSGGLSLKPTPSMVDMKSDMAGAAAVAGIMKAADALNAPFTLYGVIPVAENVISGSAYKPGDIIHTASGKTIEIGNTDAEGRLILADALEFAEKLKPNKIIDFATLTGACVVALGESYAGLFTNNDEIANSLQKASGQTAENIWRLPLPEKYNEMLKSELADISNVGNSRWGGAITAALFLKFFLSQDAAKNWAHLDIAGPAMKHSQASYTKKYATGFGVRLIAEWLENLT